jgi:cytochrome c biogenesis protein CcmG, thiol:disulfide interchange protein DsbE
MANENDNGSTNLGREIHPASKKGVPRWIIWVSLAILILIPLIDRLWPPSHNMKGKQAPDIVFSDASGKSGSLASFRGNVVLVNFWASWCVPCMEEMPALKEMEKKFAGKKFALVAIDIEEQPATVQALLTEGKLPTNVFFNPTPESIEAYDVRSIPLSLLLDRSGEMKKAFVGPRNWTDPVITTEIESLME